MTEALKQWIADQADKVSTCEKINGERFIDGKTRMPYRKGLEKGIEISIGFSKWSAWNYLLNDGPDDVWFDKKDGTTFTTSQLLELYLKTLEP